MKKTLSILGLIAFGLLFSQNISFDKLYGNSDPVHYYLGHYPVSGSDGLDINWYGGIKLQTSAGVGIQLLKEGNVGIGTSAPQSKLTVHHSGGVDSNQLELRTAHLRNPDRYFMKNIIAGTGAEDITFSLRHDGQMFVDGNVGIGTKTPTEKLTVSGDHVNSLVLLHSSGDGANQPANLALWASEPFHTYTGVGIGNNIKNYNGSQSFTLINPSAGGSYVRLLDNQMNFNLVSNSGSKQEVVTIIGNGNVGIGTNNPKEKLDVQGNILAGRTHATEGINAFAIRYEDGSLNNWGSLRSSAASYMSFGVKADPNNGNSWLSSNGNLNFYKTAFMINNDGMAFLATPQSQQTAIDSPVIMNEIMKISPNGNASLQGKLEAKELKVTLTPTADFVFEEDYRLPKLEDIEKHIKEKKHLPEIASAKEMEKEGVNVGEFQIKLLQKIEELTLHLIDLNKDVKSLKEENKELKKQLTLTNR